MSDFVVSARKYRPTTFSSVVGQSALTTTLKNAIKSNHLAHAYLFCGPRGVGKTTCARIFAKTINCQNLTPEYEACNECESCVAFNEQRSYNIHELDAASNNSVDDIRTLIEQVRIPPQIGKYKVYIIDEVHMLSSGAFNAFLKTLEEPPAHAIFILATTEKHKIIPTILSRCQIYDFNRITVQDTVEHLQYVAKQENVTADPNALNIIAQKSDGGMRDALSIFDQIVSFCGTNITYQGVIDNLNVLDYEYYFRLTDAFQKNDVTQALLIFNEVLNKGFDGHQFITGLSSHFRDLLVSKDALTIELLEVGADIGDKYKLQAQACPTDFLFKSLKISNDCDLNYRISKNKRLLVELTLIRLCQITDEKKKSITDDEQPEPLQKIVAEQSAGYKPVVETPKQALVEQPKKTTLPPTSIPVKKEQPVAQAVKPKPSPNRPGSISISSPGISNDKNQAAETQKEQPAVAEESLNETFDNKALERVWLAFTKTIPEEVRMVNFMHSNRPELTSETEFVVKVSNVLQERELIRLQTDILIFLRNELKNSYIQMIIQMEEVAESQRTLSPEERYKLWIEQNPALARLRSGLNMEID